MWKNAIVLVPSESQNVNKHLPLDSPDGNPVTVSDPWVLREYPA